MDRRIKVLIAKPGLDGHDQGAKVVVRALMEAQMKVVYSGLRRTPQEVAEMAKREEVDVIGLSSMAGSHLPFCRKLRPLLDEYGLSDRLLLVGGSIPEQDVPALHALGVKGVFGQGSRLDDIISFIRANVP